MLSSMRIASTGARALGRVSALRLPLACGPRAAVRGVASHGVAPRAPPPAGSAAPTSPSAGPGRAAPGAPPRQPVLLDAAGRPVTAATPATAGGKREAGAAGGRPAAAPAAAAAAASADPATWIMEVTEANFEEAVLKSPVAVVLDCYADWCNPCKTLTPQLENIVRAARGAVRLCKVNVDAQPGIAQSLRVRSLPTVLGIVGGRSVDMFMGVPTDEQLKSFFGKLLAAADEAGMSTGAPSPLQAAETAVAEASALIDESRFMEVLQMMPPVYEHLSKLHAATLDAMRAEAAAAAKGTGKEPLPVRTDQEPLRTLDTLSARCLAAIVRSLVGLLQNNIAAALNTGGTAASAAAAAPGATAPTTPAPTPATPEEMQALAKQVDTYRSLLSTRYKSVATLPEIAQALSAAQLATSAFESRSQMQPLLAAVAAELDNWQARFTLAETLIGAAQHEAAINHLLAIVKAAPTWNDGAARTTLLKLFASLGPSHPAAAAGRKALSKLLFR